MLVDDLLYWSSRSGNQLDAILTAGLTIAMRFQIDNVAQYAHENKHKDKAYRIEDHIPNIAPLASVMWFEYNGLAVGHSALSRYGCLLTIDYDRKGGHTSKWNEVDPPENSRWILRAEYFSSIPEGITVSDWIYFIGVGEEGEPRGMTQIESSRGEFVADESQRNVWHEEIIASLMALCFSHCKGSEIKERQPSRQVRRFAERKGKLVFTFHTIDIQPSARVLHTEGDIARNGLAKALHICRGHFAHYTTDKPLFGKYTGTFYRPMHVRGSLEQGATIKDYRVHPNDGE